MGVSAVVVTFNRLTLLKECISNLLKQTYELDHIFVVNNNSSDGTKDYLNNINNKQIVALNLDRNLGGAGGFNKGLKYAFEHSSSKYFWIMDDDTMPTPSSLDKLLVKANELNGHFGFLCSNDRWWKNKEPCNMPKVAKDWTKLATKHLIKVNQATFVSLLIPRINVKQYGLPIKDMFIWGDDTEYTTRLSNKLDSYFVPNSIVLHKSASNASYESIFNVSKNRIKYYKCMFRNLIYIDKRYYSLRRRIDDIVRFTSYLPEIPFKAKNHRWIRFCSLSESIIHGISFNPKIEFPKKRE